VVIVKILDLHCDTLLKGQSFAGNDGHVDLDRLPAGAQYAQCFAIFINDDVRGPAAAEQAEGYYRHFLRNMEQLPNRILHCRTTAEVEAAFREGRSAAILTIENGAALGGSMDNLERMAGYGVKIMTLTWNAENEIGGGSQSDAGLKPFGRDIIRRMEELKVAVDVSHLNDKTFWDVAEFTRKPILATHSNSRAVCSHARNVTDDQIRAIAETGGIAGLNYFVNFLCEDGVVTCYDGMLRHIDHLLNIGGEGFLALGSDFDGCTTPAFLSSTQDLEPFYDSLSLHFGKTLADRIFYDNAAAFLKHFD
jgi:membrane dipeptidase